MNANNYVKDFITKYYVIPPLRSYVRIKAYMCCSCPLSVVIRNELDAV